MTFRYKPKWQDELMDQWRLAYRDAFGPRALSKLEIAPNGMFYRIWRRDRKTYVDYGPDGILAMIRRLQKRKGEFHAPEDSSFPRRGAAVLGKARQGLAWRGKARRCTDPTNELI